MSRRGWSWAVLILIVASSAFLAAFALHWWHGAIYAHGACQLAGFYGYAFHEADAAHLVRRDELVRTADRAFWTAP